MFFTRPRLGIFVLLGILTGLAWQSASAHELRIVIPRRSRLTPVQRLNRDGVRAIRDHKYPKAEALFYKAYLYDPADPFTLNNLGYVAELRGNLSKADEFYKLAGEQSSDAVIAMSSKKRLQGKPMVYAVSTVKNLPMRVNRFNVQAIELLKQGHPFEARDVLKQVLPIDPQNPFTLNNLGVADEATGNFRQALQYYEQASATGSRAPIMVTLNRSWLGKPVSEAAAESARALRRRMTNTDMSLERARMLTYRGVHSVNQNDWNDAQKDFQEAFRLAPNSAFSLNNRAYLAEKAGDLETAQYYYAAAQRAGNAGAKVGLATRTVAQGQPMGAVANENTQQVSGELNIYKRSRQGVPGPVKLIPRTGNSGAQPQTHP